jgi:hypothetical protein
MTSYFTTRRYSVVAEVKIPTITLLAEEISYLEERVEDTQKASEQAADRLSEIEAQRAKLGIDAFRGVASAIEELKRLEVEVERESKIREFAQSAAAAYSTDLTLGRVALAEAHRSQARARYETRAAERFALEAEAEEAMSALLGKLDELKELHSEQARAAGDAGNHYAAVLLVQPLVERWLARRLRDWLPLSSLERYECSLPELDSLAQTQRI